MRGLISFTLDNRKVYIAYVAYVPDLSPTATHFSINPIHSGYRDVDTLDLILTTNYDKVITPTEFRSVRVLVALKDVKMAAFFDPYLYPLFGEEAVEDDPNIAR